ncbi:hypothetical protein V8E55_002837 [Tylopilus felleus]
MAPTTEQRMAADSFYRDANTLLYADNNLKPTEDAIDRVVDNGIMLCGEETDLPDIASANASSLGVVQDDGCNSGANYEYKGRWLQRNECTSDDIKILCGEEAG